MRSTRVIPVLLLHDGGVVKTRRFAKPIYVGDPVNAVKIFNDKEVDELVVLDIDAASEGRGPELDAIREIAEEAFMPLCYGGGVRNLADFEAVFRVGFEKVAVNTATLDDPGLVTQAAERFGSQSVVASIDIRKSLLGKRKVARTTRPIKNTALDPVDHAVSMERAGAGEILLNSVDLDGTGEGYDLATIEAVTAAVNVPVIACGGAGRISDFSRAVKAGAAAVAAGRMFVLQGRHDAVLISYPAASELDAALP